MKKILLILLCFPIVVLAQQTYVPDDNFEQALINLGYDNILDDYVLTANINTIQTLYVQNQNIYDLTGIEDFINLIELFCDSNQLTSLDVSASTDLIYLYCNYNQLTSLDANNPALKMLSCAHNQLISLSINTTNALTNLHCANNQLTNLDISDKLDLRDLYCHSNQLTSLDLRNGNNTNLYNFQGNNNPNLTCISVDDPTWSTANWTNIDSQSYFSSNCNSSAIQEQTTNKELLKVTDLLGRETKGTNQPLLYLYDDGTVEKRIIIE